MIKKIITLLFISLAYLSLAQEGYSLSSNSKLTINGTSSIHDWTVRANGLTGHSTAENGLPRTMDFEVDVAEIQSERGAAMDKKMHDALKKEDHPKISFILEKVNNSTNLVGTLKVAGQEKTVEIPVEMSLDGTSLKIKGQHAIILQDYDIDPPTAMFGQIIVGNDVTVKFDLVFSKN